MDAYGFPEFRNLFAMFSFHLAGFPVRFFPIFFKLLLKSFEELLLDKLLLEEMLLDELLLQLVTEAERILDCEDSVEDLAKTQPVTFITSRGAHVPMKNKNRASKVSFGDESDVDLSDDDSTYRNVSNKSQPSQSRMRSASVTNCNSSSSSNISSSSSLSSNSSSNDFNSSLKKIGKKRTGNPARWKENIAKRFRNSGKPYASMSKSKNKSLLAQKSVGRSAQKSLPTIARKKSWKVTER
ncbi:hypothetical protein EVAR_51279_1 [Eumeta japonica]|uniref:Uncharacterized protein n=1 Tax=Eumeta variegata TaxID=151549 RepID=A0A4C1YAH4_EUMVA|nr:hypothetical protein EVAR_51279_1 [Eumeta japonica]